MQIVLKATLLAAAWALGSSSGAAAQATLHVDDNAPDDPGPGITSVSDPLEDGSIAHPFDAIAEAVAAASPGDAVLIHDGLYTGLGNRSVVISKPISLASEHGYSGCIIDPEGLGNAFTITLSSPDIRGLTIRNGSNFNGGGMTVFAGSSPTISECLFVDNTASSGGGLYVENSSPDIRHCAFVFNNGSNGGAVAVRLGSSPTLRNCTFTGNGALEGGALYTSDSSTTTVANSILWANSSSGGSDEILAGADVTVTSSNVDGGLPGVVVSPGATLNWSPTNIDKDPMMVTLFSGETHLLPDSPCIGLGDPNFVDPASTDLEGDAVPNGVGADMGADEFRQRLYISGLFTLGGFVTFNAVGQPGEAILTVASAGFLHPPLVLPMGTFFLAPPLIIDPVQLGNLPASGHASVSIQVPSGLPSGLVISWQARIGTTLTGLEVLLIE